MTLRCNLIVTTLLATAVSSGCATFNLPWVDRVPEASAKNPVMKVMCLWEPAEGRDPKGLPCRGFAGQILFLGNKGGLPVKVNGDVAIYVFDDVGTPDQQSTPIHEFKFDGGSWNRHMKVGTFGPSYHVFVPYTRPGHHEATCALRLKLNAPTNPVYSDLCSIKLSGTSRDGDPETAVQTSTIELPKRQVETTTIPLDPTPQLTPADADRTNQLLEQFLRKQIQRNQEPEVPQAAGPRIRFDGQHVEVVPSDSERTADSTESLEGQTTSIP